MAIAAAESCFQGIAGVDIMSKDIGATSLENSYVIEVNLTPGIRMHQFPTIGQPRDVASKIFAAIERTARRAGSTVSHIGRSETTSFPELPVEAVHARIDTGARTSTIWVSQAHERDGALQVIFFGKGSPHYTGTVVTFKEFDRIVVTNSTGHMQTRYKVRLLVKLKGKKVRAWFTLADRSTQVYPVLIGRNVLLGKFIVDVKRGSALKEEQERIKRLKDELDKGVKNI
jgi:hypothetical protein